MVPPSHTHLAERFLIKGLSEESPQQFQLALGQRKQGAVVVPTEVSRRAQKTTERDRAQKTTERDRASSADGAPCPPGISGRLLACSKLRAQSKYLLVFKSL